MSVVVVVRPGATEFDLERRIQGQLDLPLTALGERQLANDIEDLGRLPVQQVYVSPTDPALSSGQAIAEAFGVSAKRVDGLANMNFGLWEGVCVDELRQKRAKGFRQWLEAPELVCPPQGETLGELTDRVRQALRKPLRRKGCIVLVCPEPLATQVTCLLRGAPLRTPLPGETIHESRITVIDLNVPMLAGTAASSD